VVPPELTAKYRSLPSYCEEELSPPVFVVAPMVKQCDLPFRNLCRRHGSTLVFTEMLMAKEFATEPSYRAAAFGTSIQDHPLIVQFAANDPADMLKAALEAQKLGADGVDLNLGCPQHRARESRFGAWLTDPEDWELCAAIVRGCTSSPELSIPVSCKIRLQPELEMTIQFALLLEEAGAAMLSIHGRMRGDPAVRRDGAADLDAIRAVRDALHIPVLSNGNVRCPRDVLAALARTGCEGVMSAEQLLRDPGLFGRVRYEIGISVCSETDAPPPTPPPPPPVKQLSMEYIELCEAFTRRVQAEASAERFTVWQASDADVAKLHLKGMLTATGHGPVPKHLSDVVDKATIRAQGEGIQCASASGGATENRARRVDAT